MTRKAINIDFGMCEICGKKDGAPGHYCDGGEALRKAARELFGPVMDLLEPMLVKAGTGILRGIFEVAFERDRLRLVLEKIAAGNVYWGVEETKQMARKALDER